MEELDGKVVAITGGASGIGRALADAFGAAGMKVALADIEPGPLAEAVAELSAAGIDAAGWPCDVSDDDDVHAFAAATFERFGTAHMICNNAGVGGAGGLTWEVPLEGWEWTIGVNLMGVVHGIRAFVPRMVEQGDGHIVNTASLAGLKAAPFMAAYNATKHAVVAISESLAHECAHHRTRRRRERALPCVHPDAHRGVRPQLAGPARSEPEPDRRLPGRGNDPSDDRQRTRTRRSTQRASSRRCGRTGSSSSPTTPTPARPGAGWPRSSTARRPR